MARPYFTGNYGSALARVDTRPIIEAGRATGQMYAQMGQNIGGMIKEYGLNKQKRAELTDKIESTFKLHPDYLTRMTSTGIEADDKKAQTLQDKLASGNANLTELKGIAGELAMMEAQDLKEADASRQALTDALKVSQLHNEEQTRKLKEENQNLTRIAKGREERFYGTNEKRLNDLTVAVGSGKKLFKDLSHQDKFILGNAAGIRARNIPPEKLYYDPDAEFDHEKAKVEYNKLKKEVELTDQAIAKGKAALKPGKFADLDAVNAEAGRQLDKGHIVTAEWNPNGGYNISKSVPIDEAKNELIPLDETKHPNVYRFKDSSELFFMPPGEKPSKIGVGDKGADARLQQTFLTYLNDPNSQWYATAMRNGTLEKTGTFGGQLPVDEWLYKWEDSEGIDREVKYSQEMETRVRTILRLEEKLQEQVFDIRR